MGKQYKIDTNLDVSGFTPESGFMLKQKEGSKDYREVVALTGKEVFASLCSAAVTGGNQRVSFDELRTFRRVQNLIDAACKMDGILIAGRTEIDIIKNSIRGNKGWLNSDEMLEVLEMIVQRIDGAEIIE